MNLVYTAIYGKFDKLWEPRLISSGWDYRCYTDQEFTSPVWKIIHKDVGELSQVKMSKYIKITHPMENYDNILWIDGCMEIIGDLNEFINQLPEGDIVAAKHFRNDSISKELSDCIRLKKDDINIMKNQIERYKEMKPYIHTQNGILLRRKDIKATYIWWEEVRNWSKRDQLSFAWSMQQSNQEYSTYSHHLIAKCFIWHCKHPTK